MPKIKEDMGRINWECLKDSSFMLFISWTTIIPTLENTSLERPFSRLSPRGKFADSHHIAPSELHQNNRSQHGRWAMSWTGWTNCFQEDSRQAIMLSPCLCAGSNHRLASKGSLMAELISNVTSLSFSFVPLTTET